MQLYNSEFMPADGTDFQYRKHGSIGCNILTFGAASRASSSFQYPKHGSIGCNRLTSDLN